MIYSHMLLFYPFVAILFSSFDMPDVATSPKIPARGHNWFGSGRKIDRVVRAGCPDQRSRSDRVRQRVGLVRVLVVASFVPSVAGTIGSAY
jgi:hypothetical protein